jgi:hypothetical protein
MNMTPAYLYELLPAIYRIRDAEQGEPLKALLFVMARQLQVVEDDIDQLYENAFIETCEEWLVPYIGDLLGVRPLQPAGADVFTLRAYVANTLAYRRRKGTVAVLEELELMDSFVDGGGDDEVAVAGLPGEEHRPVVHIERSTLFGATDVKELYASEVIFAGQVEVERCQTGCLRFSYVRLPDNPGKTPNTPRRYRCQPCLGIATKKEELEQQGKTPDLIRLGREISRWLAPGFVSMQYGDPAYGQLSIGTPNQIRSGAEDGSEMGAFCHLNQPQREANLRDALAEYLRPGMEAGILYLPYENSIHDPGSSQ